MTTVKDIRKKDQSPVSWRVFEEGKYFVFNFTTAFCGVDKLSNMYFLIRKNLLSAKRLNIFSPSTNEEAEPTAGNNEF